MWKEGPFNYKTNKYAYENKPFKQSFLMEDNFEKPLWHYSMREFLKLQKQEIEESLKEMLTLAVSSIKSDQHLSEDTIGIGEASKVTGLKEKSIYSKVSRLQIPSLTRGRPLMFSRAELQLWMKIGRPMVAEFELKRRKGEI
jgi:predicted DNA-binding transcriptional regulator AlpA